MKEKGRIRVLIADDHAIVRMGLSALLGAEPGFCIVGEAKNGCEAVHLALQLQPDIVIMDLQMPQKDGTTATAELHAELPATKIIILTSFGTSDDISHALAAGASAALLKNEENAALIQAIHAVADDQRFLSPQVESLLKNEPPIPELSPRQREILESIARGLTNADIAHQLGISLASVKTHVLALFDKIGAANRSEAATIALRRHLLKS